MSACRVQPHGTPAAYQRHVRAGEEPCGECREARAAYGRDHRAGLVRARQVARCGTLPGYEAHRYRGEQACRKCLDAHAEYRRGLRERARRAAVLERLLVEAWEETAGL